MPPRKRARRAPRLSDLDTYDSDGLLTVVIETPRGGRTKYAYDPEREAFVAKRVLPQGMSFPFDFGFIPSTLGDDGDPLDVLVLAEEPIPVGCIVPANLVGVIEATQTERDGEQAENPRLIAIADSTQLYAGITRLSDVPGQVLDQVEAFFAFYNEQSGKRFEVHARQGARRAAAIVEAAQARRRKR